ncbi:hypothetical protein HDU86_006612 [Geranomyces michiganensis]|nr:hypothetical protein HDU86_006612 [Geranomyces michiganensis]
MSSFPDEEGFWDRTKRKNAENPFILPAIILLGYSVVRMSSTLLRNDRVGFQNAQRLRVGSQFLALTAFAGGIAWHDWRRKDDARAAAAMAALNAPPVAVPGTPAAAPAPATPSNVGKTKA